MSRIKQSWGDVNGGLLLEFEQLENAADISFIFYGNEIPSLSALSSLVSTGEANVRPILRGTQSHRKNLDVVPKEFNETDESHNSSQSILCHDKSQKPFVNSFFQRLGQNCHENYKSSACLLAMSLQVSIILFFILKNFLMKLSIPFIFIPSDCKTSKSIWLLSGLSCAPFLMKKKSYSIFSGQITQRTLTVLLMRLLMSK